jgi:hypothetical protein
MGVAVRRAVLSTIFHDRALAGSVPSCASVADPEKEMVSPTFHVVPLAGAE